MFGQLLHSNTMANKRRNKEGSHGWNQFVQSRKKTAGSGLGMVMAFYTTDIRPLHGSWRIWARSLCGSR